VGQLSYVKSNFLTTNNWLTQGQPGGTGAYYQVADGTGPFKLEFDYLLKTNDEPPAYILVKQSGWEVNYIGRTNYVLETGDSRYSFVNTGVWTGVETGYVNNATGTFCEFFVEYLLCSTEADIFVASVDGYLIM